MKYKEYIVKSTDEEFYNQYWVVKVPANIPENEVYAVFNKASKYAYCFQDGLSEEEGIAEYDEHYMEMNSNSYGCGFERFNGYIRKFYGWEVTSLDEDFEYEW